jgi:hypothetical protein
MKTAKNSISSYSLSCGTMTQLSPSNSAHNIRRLYYFHFLPFTMFTTSSHQDAEENLWMYQQQKIWARPVSNIRTPYSINRWNTCQSDAEDTSVASIRHKLQDTNFVYKTNMVWIVFHILFCCYKIQENNQASNLAVTNLTCENKHNCNNGLNNVSVYSEATCWITDNSASPFLVNGNRSKEKQWGRLVRAGYFCTSYNLSIINATQHALRSSQHLSSNSLSVPVKIRSRAVKHN